MGRIESSASRLRFFKFLADNKFRVGRWFDKVDRKHNPQNAGTASSHLVVLLVIREYLDTVYYRAAGGGGGGGTTSLGQDYARLCGDVSFNYLGELVAGA